ncbi:MAG: MBL fold metallo-hydrolase [Pseudomonadales bacterium]|nr:MBL fold metallo-hydrolase [Pseudomonadales bacterium]
MLLKYFYDDSLAHASYLVGCQKSGEAIVIDPGRDVVPYLDAAKANGLRVIGAAETHIHADFVSGARELADRVGATLYLSDEGPSEWKYEYADRYETRLLHDGDTFFVGKVRFEVLHTPGHTPESISYLLTDEGSGANVPMGIFSGDFVFVGSVGRPDLLETAAGIVGSAEFGAQQLFQSVHRFRDLPGHLQVWPAHGAGSACGKGLGAIPSSTVGYERLFNPALQYDDEKSFVAYILADQPETPFYFAMMKRVNKVGPELTRNLPAVGHVPASELAATAAKHLVIDTGAAAEYAESHVPGTINVPASNLVQWAGFFVDYDEPVFLVTDEGAVPAQLRSLRSIGIDNVGGYFDAGEVTAAGLKSESYPSLTPAELKPDIEGGDVTLVDVRATTEFNEGHIAGAEHHFLGTLLREIQLIRTDKPVVAQCLAGGRSAIAASVLQRAGFDVINMKGGYRAWVDEGYSVVRDTASSAV